MKTTFTPVEIIENVSNLIKRSCDGNYPETQKTFDRFHLALLKRYFGTSNIIYTRKADHIEIEVFFVDTSSQNIHIELTPEKLENFLRSCIKKDTLSIGFYDNMLLYYSTHKQGEKFHLQSA